MEQGLPYLNTRRRFRHDAHNQEEENKGTGSVLFGSGSQHLHKTERTVALSRKGCLRRTSSRLFERSPEDNGASQRIAEPFPLVLVVVGKRPRWFATLFTLRKSAEAVSGRILNWYAGECINILPVILSLPLHCCREENVIFKRLKMVQNYIMMPNLLNRTQGNLAIIPELIWRIKFAQPSQLLRDDSGVCCLVGDHDLHDLHFECRLIFSVTKEGTDEPGLWKCGDAGRIPASSHPFYGNLGLMRIVVSLSDESGDISDPASV